MPALQAHIARIALIAFVSAAASKAQAALYLVQGHESPGELGKAVCRAGDVDGDGAEDFILGDLRDSTNGTYAGSAKVFSGATGGILLEFYGAGPDAAFGTSVSWAGDVNADGFADVIVGAPYEYADHRGSARVYSGKDGALIHLLEGLSANARFGYSVSGAGDADGDGFADLLIGAPYAAGAGRAYVVSGADGLVLYEFDGGVPTGSFGYTVALAGDVNADGAADWTIGAPFYTHGRAYVFSGADGSKLWTFESKSPNARFAEALDGAGDVDADGFDDIVVGAWADGTNGYQAGIAQVFSGKDGGVLRTFLGHERLAEVGIAVAGGGDWNADGFADVVVTARRSNTSVGAKTQSSDGVVRIYSGGDGSVLETLSHEFGVVPGYAGLEFFGFALSALDDLDGDGLPEIIIGSSHADTDNGKDTGAVLVYSLDDTPGENYCGPANSNSTGQSSRIQAVGSRVARLHDLRLEADDLPPLQFGYFLTSLAQGFVAFPGGSQGNLCLGGSIGRYSRSDEVRSSGPAGQFDLRLVFDDTPQPGGPVTIQAGETWNFQAWFRDKNPGPTSNFTDGVSVTFY